MQDILFANNHNRNKITQGKLQNHPNFAVCRSRNETNECQKSEQDGGQRRAVRACLWFIDCFMIIV